MQEELITYETAVLAKEKGFNETSRHAFHANETEHEFPAGCVLEILADHYYLRPTQSLLQRWLREEHNIDIVPLTIRFTGYLDIGYYTYAIKGIQPVKNYRFKSWELALETALQEALKLINNEKNS
jgi:hypothetical protein